MSEAAKLTVNDQQVELPLVVGSEQEVGIDISKLRASTGAVTLDEGYVNTGSTTSAITFLDGEKGVLRYRGYPIEQLAKHCDFTEVAYLLMHGELPTQSELDHFQGKLKEHCPLPPDMASFFKGFPPTPTPWQR